MRKGPLRIPQSFRGSKGGKVNLWREVGGVGNGGGGVSPFCTEELVCHQRLRLPFVQLGRKTEVCKTTSSLERGDKYLRLHAKEWRDRWAKGRGSAEGQGQVQVLPSPEEGQVHRRPASLQVRDSPPLALLPSPPPGSAPKESKNPLYSKEVCPEIYPLNS